MEFQLVGMRCAGGSQHLGENTGAGRHANGGTGSHIHHGRECKAMTAVVEVPQPDVEGISQPQAVVVGVMAGTGVRSASCWTRTPPSR